MLSLVCSLLILSLYVVDIGCCLCFDDIVCCDVVWSIFDVVVIVPVGYPYEELRSVVLEEDRSLTAYSFPLAATEGGRALPTVRPCTE